jgi:6-phosphofructokinase 1
MNACVRAVVRSSLASGAAAVGIREGFHGLVHGTMNPLKARDVGSILQRGGTVLQTARSPEFAEPAGQRQAQRALSAAGVEGLVVIGGDGSMRGAHALALAGFPVVGVPGSIDNDVWGSDMSVGVDTALNTIMDAIDKLRDTASSHQRAFLIETMGRRSGYLALTAGLICGAEVVLIPEIETTLEEVTRAIADAYERGKAHAIIVAAEGAGLNAEQVVEALAAHQVGFEVRITILGHVQRGGSPTAFDRLLATRMGVRAVELLQQGASDVMVGLRGRDLLPVPLAEVTERQREVDERLHAMARMLAL